MRKKLTQTQKLLQSIMETNPGISVQEAWRLFHIKYETEIELDPKRAERLSKPIKNIHE